MKLCSIENCENKKRGKEWCMKHYQRWKKYGDPLFTKKRELYLSNKELLIWITSEPQIKKVESQKLGTFCLVWIGSKNKQAYGRLGYKDKVVLVHRLVWYLTKGSWPKGNLKHRCNNPSCTNLNHLENYSENNKKRKNLLFLSVNDDKYIKDHAQDWWTYL